MPHMITVDRAGDLWVTDVGRHQALKFSPTGKMLMALGQELVPGHDQQHMCKPTHVRALSMVLMRCSVGS